MNKDDNLDYLTKRFDCFKGSINYVISLAMYLGFSKCYLVGFDYTHDPVISHHWYEDTKGIVTQFQNTHYEFFRIAREFIDIVTVTKNTGSMVLPSITYKELTKKELKYCENNSLLEKDHYEFIRDVIGYRYKKIQ